MTMARQAHSFLIRVALLAAVAFFAGPSWASDVDDYLASAQRQLDKGDRKGAAIELRNASRADPANVDIHLRLAQLYLSIGDIPAAEAEARSAHAHGAEDTKVAPLLAEALLRGGRYDMLLKEVTPGDRPAPIESVVRMSLGLAHLGMGEPAQAEPLLRDAERLDPTAAEPKVGVARLLLVQDHVDAAAAEIAAALAIDPQNDRALLVKADLLRLNGDVDRAVALYDGILSRSPDSLTARLGRANLRIITHDLAGAQEDVKQILVAAPDDVATNYLQALIYVRSNELDKANVILEKFASRFSDFPPGLLLMGSVELALGQTAQAETNLTHFMAQKPDSSIGARMLAEIALRQHDPTKAIALLEPVTKASPDDAATWALVASAYLASGQNDKASAALDRAAAGGGSNLQLDAGVAVTRFAVGQTDRALAELQEVFDREGGPGIAGPALIMGDLKAHRIPAAATAAEAFVKSEPDNLVAQNLLGLVRISSADLKGAEQIFETLASKHPEFTVGARNLAEVYLAEGRTDDAIRAYRAVLVHHNDDMPSHLALANVLLGANDVNGAVEELKAAAAVTPNDPAPLLRLANLYAAAQKWPEALTVLHGLDAQFPNNLDVADLLARTQLASGDKAACLATYKRAVDSAPKSAVLLARFSLALTAADDLDGARKALDQALALDPKNDSYRASIVALDYRRAGTEAALSTGRALLPPGADAALPAQWTAAALNQAGKLDEALAIVAGAAHDHPSERLVAQQAALFVRAGKQDQAAAIVKAWVDSHADDLAARRILADLYISTKRFDLAEAGFEKLATAAPDAAVLNNLAWLYQRHGDSRALQTAQRAYAMTPLAPAVSDTLGWIMVTGGDPSGALPFLSGAHIGRPQDADVQYHLAVALNRTGKASDARQLLEQIVAQNAAFDSRDDAVALLRSLGGKVD